MKIKIKDILLQLGVPSQEIKIRTKSGQIKLNGTLVTDGQQEVMIAEDPEHPGTASTQDLGDFVFATICPKPLWRERAKRIGIENLFDCNLDNDLTHVINNHLLLAFSKKDRVVLTKDL